ncbi:homoserine kinase [Minwuia sp.]|uniref:homoserine kinase n=1 Tax=Minwuia sp. TaxID=2493630 RepID=UPI003A8E119C
MAVYTDIDDDELDGLLLAYDIGRAVACKGIAEGVENSNFLLQTDQGPFILTIYEKRVNSDDLPWFLGLMAHLNANGLPCPQPIVRRDGGLLSRASGKPAAIVSFLNGRWPKKPKPVHTQKVGDALARLHLAGADLAAERANGLSVSAWRDLLSQCGERSDEVHDGLYDALTTEVGFLEAHWPDALPRGVIHADMFPDNVFFIDEELSGVIDFYFACTDVLVYDLAICLNAWCFEPDGAFNITKARQMLGAYRERRALTRDEFDALPVLARGAAMRFLLTRLYDWLNHPEGALVTPKDPMEYWHKLAFHQKVASATAYGLDF